MTAKKLTDVHPVLLDAGYDSGGALEVLYESSSLQNYDDELTLVLDDNNEVQMRLADFTASGSTYNVYAWTIDTSGGLTSWTRVGSTAQSETVQASALPELGNYDADFVALEELSGNPAPTPTTEAQATAQGGRRIRVKIRKGGVRPIPPVTRR